MATYTYKARDNFGKLVVGSLPADSQSQVVEKLREAGLIAIEVGENSGKVRGRVDIFKLFRGVKASELSLFSLQFAVLQKAGVSMVARLYALRDQATNDILKKTFEDIAAEIKKGQTVEVISL